MGLDLIEWTYDPLQALNAHLNFSKLGVVVEEYEENIYGESTSPLHQRHADRSIRRGVAAARRRTSCAGSWRRRADCARQLGGGRAARQPVAAGGAVAGAGRRLDCRGYAACWSRFPSASRRCWSATPRWRCEWRMSTRADLPALFRPRLSRRWTSSYRDAGRGQYLLARKVGEPDEVHTNAKFRRRTKEKACTIRLVAR